MIKINKITLRNIKKQLENKYIKQNTGLPTDEIVAKINRERNYKKYNSIFYLRNNKDIIT